MPKCPNPNCENDLSFRAQRCPKCDEPIDDNVRSRWKAENSFKNFVGGLAFIIFIGFMAYGYISDMISGPDSETKDMILAELSPNHPRIQSWVGDDLYGGTAVVVNDIAGFWVKDGTVYTTNGPASQWAENAKAAPPSVTQMKIEDAVNGSPAEMPPFMNVSYLNFINGVAERLEPHTVYRVTPLEYSVDKSIQLDVRETGGMLTAAYTSFYVRSGQMELPLKVMQAFITAAAPGITPEETDKVATELVKASAEKRNSHFNMDGYGALFDMVIDDQGVLELMVTPKTE